MVAVSSSVDQGTRRADAKSLIGVRRWLLLLILLVFAMVLVGGATRLTESGLSITEWDLVTGTVPPLDSDAWNAEFDRYKASPQYDLLNRGMSLDSFKTIYWWEWAHRELGRFIGLIYIAGFFWFVGKRGVPLRTALVLAAMGLLLGAQGVVGWIMVASGLEPGMSAVQPIRLTLHLTLAALFFAALVTMFVRLGGVRSEPATVGERIAAAALVFLVLIQIALGGLVAGHDAGLTYNTWPLMDGRLIPKGLGAEQPIWRNVFNNITAIQFNHRVGAYVLAAAILAYAVAARRAATPARHRAILLAVLILLQIIIGIATLVAVVPINLALMHQAMALVLLLVLVWNAAALRQAPA
jgi:cytochrome c oxidase assembly protein subunit 15